jgi:hypothetical protein
MRTRSWMALICIAALALVAGCAGTEELKCFEGACNPGTCDDTSGTAVCTCPDKYEAVAGLICQKKIVKMGEACVDSTECETGWCLRYSDGTGYCSKRDCLNNDACINYAAGETAEMCCVDVGGDYKVCLKIEPDYACGNQDKTCGQSCVGQMDSACDPNHACLSGSDTYCSHACVTNADCNDCQAEDPDVTFQCMVIGGGDSYCIAANDQTCTASSQCDAGEACTPYIDSTGNALQGYCVSGGTLTAGEECNEDDDQCKGMCISEHCSEVCETDGDCPEQNTCMSVSFCKTMEGTGDCATCTESFPDIKMCIWYPLGTQPAGAACAFGSIHPDAGDCQAGMACLGIDATDAPCTTVEDCADEFEDNWNAECVIGTCGNPNHCGSSFCSPRCAADGTCDEGFQPAAVGSDCYCIPAPEPGQAEQGDPCPFDATNADADNCKSGLICLGIPAAADSTACTAPADCESDFLPSWNPDCVDVAGTGRCGASFCSGRCDAAGACADGFVPQDVSGSCYCIPGETGSSGPGDPCPFGSVNGDSEACQGGLQCLGIPADADSTACTTAADCSADFLPSWNPDCVDVNGTTRCGASFCSPPCGAGDTCDPGFVPQDVSGSCYCIPGETGDSGPGDPCPFDGANATADACQAGLTCLGFSVGAGSPDCPNGDADCVTALGAAYNPDCVDFGGAPKCGASFCSPACGAGDTCDAGFSPQDVSGSCYCIPVETGDSAAGDPCPYDTINDTADFCQAGLACLGMAASAGSPDCANGVADCVTALGAEINPDCVDVAGSPKCGASFCSAPCVAGACEAGFVVIDVSGDCYCQPAPCAADCTGKVCGDDGCGGSCGTCTAPDVCDAAGQCCTPDCTSKECGDDGCGGSCGACAEGNYCDATFTCAACSCGDQDCGVDQCGTSCGTCVDPQVCDATSHCVDP